jgi:succinate dehydrogenase / fumarate reductase membrane anchor subunit
MKFRTPLARAKGLGSAKSGVDSWLSSRVFAVALVPLVIWLVIGLIRHAGADFEAASAWVGQPVNAVLMILLLGAMFHHAQLGMQVIYEDYIHTEWLKVSVIYLTKFAAYLLAAASSFAVLKVALGG